MTALVAYLNFDGNCRDAMTFYKTCLGADLQLVTFDDMPGGAPPAMKDRIMHAHLSKGKTALMASDTMPWGARFGMLTDKFGIQWMFNYEHPK